MLLVILQRVSINIVLNKINNKRYCEHYFCHAELVEVSKNNMKQSLF